MNPALSKRLFLAVILAAVLLPITLSYSGLPGPSPPSPPPVPTPPPDANFDYVKVDDARGKSGVATQIELGTPGKDKIIQYGGTDSITQFIGGAAANDWVLQVGGSQASQMTCQPGTGDDTVYQYGGQGNNFMDISGARGNDTLIQVGGPGDNVMVVYDWEGNDYIEVYGGGGNNKIRVYGGPGDDVIKMYGGPRHNDMTYESSNGNDVVTILGGRGYNSLIIHPGYRDFILKDYQGNALFKPGYDPPSTAPVAVLSGMAGVVTAGLHSVRVGFLPRPEVGGVFYYKPGPSSAPVQADGAHAIDVSNIPLGPAGDCQGRLLYMNQAGGDIWYLAATLMDNFSTTCTINISDSALASQPFYPGFTEITVANLNRITVVGTDGKLIWQYGSGPAPAALWLLLLLGD